MHNTFIRHYKLEPPYDKTDTITHEQYVMLSKGGIDPHINTDVLSYIATNQDINNYLHTDLLLASPTNRTKESGEALKTALKLNCPIQITDLLKECIWNPELEGSRITRFIKGTELSTLENTWSRIHELDNYLTLQPAENIVCVTHSFFMQILYLFYVRKTSDWKNITEADIKESFHGDYLKGFTVNI